MVALRPTDEHAQAPDDPTSLPTRLTLKRRGLIAGAAALTAGLIAHQERVTAATTLVNNVNFGGSPDANLDGIQGYAGNSPVGSICAGVFGRNNDLNGIGVRGNAPSGQAVVGETATGVALSGTATTGTAVYGASTSGIGLYGTSANAYGVFGIAGSGSGAAGVYGYSTTANGVAVGGAAVAPGVYAGYFSGAVTVAGNFAVTGSKAAAVLHPDGTHRLLYCVESPESWFMDFGDGTLVGGKATITLDADFAALVETSGYRVLVTPTADCNGLFVTARTATGFVVQEGKAGTSGATFSYCVIARRKDITGARLAKTTLPTIVAPPKEVATGAPAVESAPTGASAPAAVSAPAPAAPSPESPPPAAPTAPPTTTPTVVPAATPTAAPTATLPPPAVSTRSAASGTTPAPGSAPNPLPASRP